MRESAVNDNKEPTGHRPLISHGHRKRSLLTWLVPLAVIIAIMVLAPKLAEMLAN